MGDHVPTVAAGLSEAQKPLAAAPQVYPHIGTVEPSGRVTVDGPAVRLTDVCALAIPAPKRRTAAPRAAVLIIALKVLVRISVLLSWTRLSRIPGNRPTSSSSFRPETHYWL